jgi:hypothetical protein
MSAAPSWPLVIVAPSREASLRSAILRVAPGLNFDPFPRPEGRIRRAFVLSSFFRPSKRKTTRGATKVTPARQIHLVTDCKSPKLPNLPTAYGRKRRRSPTTNRAFVLPPRYGAAIMEIRGTSPRIPTLFCVRRPPGLPFARLLQRTPNPARNPCFCHGRT